MACAACNSSGTSPCYTLDEMNSQAEAASTPWNAFEVAQNILNVMKAMGIGLNGMDAAMAVAAMSCQGCQTLPNDCFQGGFSQKCSPPTNKEGYGVLQDTYFTTLSPNRLVHSETAWNEAKSFNAQDVFFPAGTGISTNPYTVAISPCTVVADPGVAFATFYFWALHQELTYNENNCQTIGSWMGGPALGVACGECAYTAYTGIGC